jgi:hypothetical protein
MAGTHPFLSRLRGVLKGLDDEALAALANKGLLRRAQKDLEASKPRVESVEEGRVRLAVAEAAVEVTELLSKSTCSCPAPGICRHIVAALVYLRDAADFGEDAEDDSAPAAVAAPAVAPPTSPAEVLGSLSDEQLQKWAGKALVRKAMKALAAALPIEIDAGASLVIRFPSRNITCRWIPGAGIHGMLCSCQADSVCEHVVTAVLAYQVSLGRREIATEEAALKESSGAPRSRAEVLASVGTLLREVVSLGLARLSPAVAERLTTLAISAHGVDLPRLERMLKSLASEVQLALRRDAQSSTANLLAQAARVEALRTALLKNATPPLVGQHRTQYHEVGQIELVGLGAQQWRSKGGYHGVTLFFWDLSRGDWATWSDSRPVTLQGFDPVARFRGEGPWAGCDSPQQAAASVLHLSRAFRNPQGRLSGRPATRALVSGPSKPLEIPAAMTSWSSLAEQARRLFGGGLAERAENLELALLVPKVWGPAAYDPLRQELVRPIADDQGRVVDLWLPFAPENEAAIEWLERHASDEPTGLLGSLRLISGRICVQPISVFVGDRIVHLTLQDRGKSKSKSARKKSAAAAVPENEETLDEEEEDALPQVAAVTALGRLLVTSQAEVEGLVEGGIAARRNLDLLQSAAKRLEALGLCVCSRPLAHLVEALVRSSDLAEPDARDRAAGRLLHAYYLLRLAADQETVEAACAGLV